MCEAIITLLNRRAHGKRCRRFWGIATEVFWVDIIRLYEFDPETIEEPDITDTSIRWAVATEEDIDAMQALGGYNIQRDFLASFVHSDNEELILGIENDLIQTYAVCAVKKKRMNGLFFRLNDDEAFISVCFTHPESRGRGWGPGCIREICRRCRENGIRNVFIDISTSNTASIRSAQKAGARLTDTWYYRVRIWKRDYLFPSGSFRSRFVRS